MAKDIPLVPISELTAEEVTWMNEQKKAFASARGFALNDVKAEPIRYESKLELQFKVRTRAFYHSAPIRRLLVSVVAGKWTYVTTTAGQIRSDMITIGV